MKFIVHAEKETRTPDVREIRLGVYAVEAESGSDAVGKVAGMLQAAADTASGEGLGVDPTPIPSVTLPQSGAPNLRVYRHTERRTREFFDMNADGKWEAIDFVSKLDEENSGVPQINWMDDGSDDVEYHYDGETLEEVAIFEKEIAKITGS